MEEVSANEKKYFLEYCRFKMLSGVQFSIKIFDTKILKYHYFRMQFIEKKQAFLLMFRNHRSPTAKYKISKNGPRICDQEPKLPLRKKFHLNRRVSLQIPDLNKNLNIFQNTVSGSDIDSGE